MSDTAITLNDTVAFIDDNSSSSFFSWTDIHSKPLFRLREVYSPESPVYYGFDEIKESNIDEEFENSSLAKLNQEKEKFISEIEALPLLESYYKNQNISLPNDYAISCSIELVCAFLDNELVPYRIAPSVEEGVCFVFKKEKKFLYIEIYNDKELGLIIEDYENKKILKNIEASKIEELIVEVKEFSL